MEGEQQQEQVVTPVRSRREFTSARRRRRMRSAAATTTLTTIDSESHSHSTSDIFEEAVEEREEMMRDEAMTTETDAILLKQQLIELAEKGKLCCVSVY